MRFVLAAAAVILFLVPPLPARAAPGWDLTFTHLDGERAASARLRMEGDHIRASDPDSPQEVLVDDSAFTMIDHEKQTYMVVTFAQIETTLLPMMRAIQEMAAGQREALEEAMGELEEDERAEVEKDLAGLAGGDVEVQFKDSGVTGQVAGLEARRLDVMKDDERVGEVWVTPEIPTGPIRSLATRFIDLLGEFMDETDGADLLASLPRLEAFPVRFVDLSEGTPREVMVLTGAKRASFQPADWALPAGYAQTLMNLGGR